MKGQAGANPPDGVRLAHHSFTISPMAHTLAG
jgi:hypothetical protein